MSEKPTATKKPRAERPPKPPSTATIKFLGSVFVKGSRSHAPEVRVQLVTTAGTEKQWKAAEVSGLALCKPGASPDEREVSLTKSGEQLLREWVELALF